MGRRKISISPIKDERTRHITFMKRKQGLLKKAYELGVLCNCEVALIVFTPTKKVVQFSNSNLEKMLLKYTEHSHYPNETYTPANFVGNKFIKDVSDDDNNYDDKSPSPLSMGLDLYNDSGFEEQEPATLFDNVSPDNSVTSLPTPPASYSAVDIPTYSETILTSGLYSAVSTEPAAGTCQNALWPGMEMSPASTISDSCSAIPNSNISYLSNLTSPVNPCSVDRTFDNFCGVTTPKISATSQNSELLFSNNSFTPAPVQRRFRPSQPPPFTNYSYMNNMPSTEPMSFPQGRFRQPSAPPNFNFSSSFPYAVNPLQATTTFGFME